MRLPTEIQPRQIDLQPESASNPFEQYQALTLHMDLISNAITTHPQRTESHYPQFGITCITVHNESGRWYMQQRIIRESSAAALTYTEEREITFIPSTMATSIIFESLASNDPDNTDRIRIAEAVIDTQPPITKQLGFSLDQTSHAVVPVLPHSGNEPLSFEHALMLLKEAETKLKPAA